MSKITRISFPVYGAQARPSQVGASRILPVFAGAILMIASLAAIGVDQRTMNNGNLILVDVPEIPGQLVEDMSRYQSVRTASLGGWTRSGAILIGTRFGDVVQLHRVDMPGGARRQLTFFREPVDDVAVRPEADTLAFTMDAGGSEFTQIFLLDLGSGEHRMISDGESRNGSLLWSPDGGLLAYQSTRRNGAANDIWLAAVQPDGRVDHRLLVESPDGSWWGPRAFSPDQTRLLVLQYISATHSLVHVSNLETGKRKQVVGGGDRESSNIPVDFNARGDGIYVITDRYGEYNQLVFHDLGTGAETVVTADIPWDVDDMVFSRDKRRAAFLTNEGGISRLYLLSPRDLSYRMVRDLPTGIIEGMEFNRSGDRLALSINTSRTPADVYVLELGRAANRHRGLERWTYSEVGGLNTDAFIEPELIHYPTFDAAGGGARQIPAFVYTPPGPGPHPVIIYIHGGPESQYRPSFSSTLQLWLEKLGAAVIAPNVRGSSGYGKGYLALDNGVLREDSVRDIGALLDWIATREDLDVSRVGVYGGSYGGYMVLACAVHYSERLRAAVDVVGISNFVTFLENTQDYRRDLRRVEYGDERDPVMRAHLQRISPNNNVSEIRIPMLVVQGENVPRVPVTESAQIVQALRGNGNQVWYMNALNEGHGYAKKENRDVYQQAAVLFFRRFLLD